MSQNNDHPKDPIIPSGHKTLGIIWEVFRGFSCQVSPRPPQAGCSAPNWVVNFCAKIASEFCNGNKFCRAAQGMREQSDPPSPEKVKVKLATRCSEMCFTETNIPWNHWRSEQAKQSFTSWLFSMQSLIRTGKTICRYFRIFIKLNSNSTAYNWVDEAKPKSQNTSRVKMTTWEASLSSESVVSTGCLPLSAAEEGGGGEGKSWLDSSQSK